jgi:anhydro-N-acetylmuramic acid kinase
MQQAYTAIGLMSGSSLDGLDICCVQFKIDNDTFLYNILHTTCLPYLDAFREKLKNTVQLSAFELAKLDVELGIFFGENTKKFIQEYQIQHVDFICSHGQTIFHQPQLGFTVQIGNGNQIAATTGIKTIADLRIADVAQGGQGAPIVPIAEKYLFSKFNIFLNIGGICNISFHQQNNIRAYDICAGNTLLNYLANLKNIAFDKNGNLSRIGTVNLALLEQLNAIEFCRQIAPKSLGTEHVVENWIKIINQSNISIEDKLATSVEHIAIQIGKAIEHTSTLENAEMLVTGGGALNVFLIERIQHHSKLKITIPNEETVQFKEALAMAFFGLLHILQIPNCISSVTGAKKDVIGGLLYLP